MLDLFAIPETLNWLSFIGLIVVSCFTSMLTASLGIGGGMFMLAAIAQLMPVKAIIPIHGAIQLGSNTSRVLVMFNNVQWHLVLWFTLGSILGALVGGQFVINLPADLLRGILGLFILITVWVPGSITTLASNKALFLGGALSTFLTMFMGATGPFVLAVMRAFNLNRLNLVATSAACLVIQHALKVLVFAALGFAYAPYALLIILMVCSGFIGTIIGKKLLISLDEQRFQYWFNIILSVLALRLLWMAFL